MSAGINSNFSNLPSYVTQGNSRQQQIQALTNQVKSNEGKIAKIDKEIVAREKIIVACEESKEAAKTIITEALKMIDYGQKGIKACEESKVLLHKAENILEALIARNEVSKAYSKASDYSIPGKAYTTPYDEAYEESFKRAMDTSQTTESLGLKKPENIDFFDRISHNPVEKHYLFSMFTEWFSGFRSSTSSFFRWF